MIPNASMKSQTDKYKAAAATVAQKSNGAACASRNDPAPARPAAMGNPLCRSISSAICLKLATTAKCISRQPRLSMIALTLGKYSRCDNASRSNLASSTTIPAFWARRRTAANSSLEWRVFENSRYLHPLLKIAGSAYLIEVVEEDLGRYRQAPQIVPRQTASLGPAANHQAGIDYALHHGRTEPPRPGRGRISLISLRCHRRNKAA